MNFDEKISKIMKETIIKDLIESKCSEDKEMYYRDKIKNDFINSDYAFRRDLYSELNNLLDE